MSADAAAVLGDINTLEGLLAKDDCSGVTGKSIVTLLKKYDFDKFDLVADERWFKINEVRGRLFRIKTVPAGIELLAKGRSSWQGWIELTRETVNSASTDNTARVIQAVTSDLLCLVEVEDRHTLDRFNRMTLAKFKNLVRAQLADRWQ